MPGVFRPRWNLYRQHRTVVMPRTPPAVARDSSWLVDHIRQQQQAARRQHRRFEVWRGYFTPRRTQALWRPPGPLVSTPTDRGALFAVARRRLDRRLFDRPPFEARRRARLWLQSGRASTPSTRTSPDLLFDAEAFSHGSSADVVAYSHPVSLTARERIWVWIDLDLNTCSGFTLSVECMDEAGNFDPVYDSQGTQVKFALTGSSERWVLISSAQNSTRMAQMPFPSRAFRLRGTSSGSSGNSCTVSARVALS